MVLPIHVDPKRSHRSAAGTTVIVKSLCGLADSGWLKTLSSMPMFVRPTVGLRNSGPKRRRTFDGGAPGSEVCANNAAGASSHRKKNAAFGEVNTGCSPKTPGGATGIVRGRAISRQRRVVSPAALVDLDVQRTHLSVQVRP